MRLKSPIRPARPPFRKRRCPRDQAEWSGAISPAWTSRRGIEPGRGCERRYQPPPFSLALSGAANEQVAVRVDVAPNAAFGRQALQIALSDVGKSLVLPGIDRHH